MSLWPEGSKYFGPAPLVSIHAFASWTLGLPAWTLITLWDVAGILEPRLRSVIVERSYSDN